MNTIVRIALVIPVFAWSFHRQPFPNSHRSRWRPMRSKKPPRCKAPAPATKTPLAFGLAGRHADQNQVSSDHVVSKDAKVDERVDFEVFDDVKVGDVVIIERGAMAIATRHRRPIPNDVWAAREKLHINIDYVRLANGEKVPLRAVKGGVAEIISPPCSGDGEPPALSSFRQPQLFLFMHGKDMNDS